MPRYPVDQRIKIPGQIPFGQPDPNAKHGYHAGDDSANGTGTPVYAAASGVVTPNIGGTAPSNKQGITLEIFDGTYYPHVFHLRERKVNPGDHVTEGQLIGYSDNTGLSTGPHVHFGVGKKPFPTTTSINDYIDPMEYIKKGGIMSVVNDGDTTNYFLALFDRMPDQAELDKNRGKEWNIPDPKLRAPLYDDMIGRGHYLTEENKRLQKLLDDSGATYQPVTEQLYSKK